LADFYSDTNLSARLYNSRVQALSDVLAEIVATETGLVPENFPENVNAIQRMEIEELNSLLAFYALPTTGNSNAKRIRLQSHLGVPRL
jgi:hypothetical protein